MLHDMRFSNNFLAMTLKTQAPKAKWGYIKLKNFAYQKILSISKTKIYRMEKYFHSIYVIMGYYPKYIRNSYNSVTTRQVTLFLKMSKGFD
jgi:hypothetical protein